MKVRDDYQRRQQGLRAIVEFRQLGNTPSCHQRLLCSLHQQHFAESQCLSRQGETEKCDFLLHPIQPQQVKLQKRSRFRVALNVLQVPWPYPLGNTHLIYDTLYIT